MKTKILMAIFAIIALAVPATLAGQEWVNPTPANLTLLNVQTVTFNISSIVSSINITGTVFEWTNQTGAVVNLTPTQVNNASQSGVFNYTYITINNMLAGRHMIKAYINQTPGGINFTFSQDSRNITIDLSADTITITDPVASVNYRKLSTASNLTIQLNFSVSATGLATNDRCSYDILADSGTGVLTTFVANTTVSCTITSLGITPKSGGTSIVEVYQNDTASNLVRSSISFQYGIDQVGGAGSGGGGGGAGIATTTVVPIKTGTPAVQPQPVKTGDNGRTIIIGAIVILGIWYFFFRKKKKKR